MKNESKLRALRRTYEVEEQRALERKKQVDEVASGRQKRLDKILEKRSKLTETLNKIRTGSRTSALQAGDAQRLSSLSRYERRLKKQLDELSPEVLERERELNMALERAEIAQEELIEARIETKKVDKFLENRKNSERVVDAAIEEALADEMNFYRRDK